MKNTIERAALRAQTPFKNAALIDFTKEENRQAQMQALEQVKSELGRTYPLIIGGQKITNKDTFASVNPSQPDQVIGYFSRATVEQANQAVQAAATAFESWKRVPAGERAGYLFAAADLMRERRFYFNAWMIYEVGKSWPEADGDTAEAIDFVEFPGRYHGWYDQRRFRDRQYRCAQTGQHISGYRFPVYAYPGRHWLACGRGQFPDRLRVNHRRCPG